MYIKLSVISLLGMILTLPVLAEPQTFRNGPNRVGTIELYTSEGCSSCPPAEHFLNQLRHHPRLWQDFIPMALHVDYWNYLGWRDRFSSAEYSQRQRQYARLRRMRTVYTPGFFVDGREWRRGFADKLPKFNTLPAGNLTLVVEKQAISGEFEPVDTAITGLQVNTALLGMGLTTEIKSGERAGHVSEHEFVVLGISRAQLQGHHFTGMLPTSTVMAKSYAVVVWLSQGSDPTPLQAVGGVLK